MALNLSHDLLRDDTPVQRIRPFVGDALQYGGQCRVFQAGANGFRAAIGIQEVGHHVGRTAQRRIRRDQLVQAWRNGETLLRQFDRRFEQLRPRQAAMFFVGQFKGAQYAWRPHRTTTNLRPGERHGSTIGLQEKPFRGAGRCRFSSVISAHVFAVPQHDQRATADAGRLRLDQRQYRLHCNRCIDGRTATTQHFPPGSGRQRVGGCCHVPGGVPGLQVGAITGRAFRRDGQRRDRWRVAGGQG